MGIESGILVAGGVTIAVLVVCVSWLAHALVVSNSKAFELADKFAEKALAQSEMQLQRQRQELVANVPYVSGVIPPRVQPHPTAQDLGVEPLHLGGIG